MILELAGEYSRHLKGPAGLLSPGDLVIRRQEVTDIDNHLVSAIAKLIAADKVPQQVSDRDQLALLTEDLRPKQLVLLDVVPPGCAPAFQREI